MLVQRLRNNVAVPNPSDTGFEIPEIYQDLILYDSGKEDNSRILILADKEVIRDVTTEEWFADGTFSKVPLQFYQLYSLHCKVGSAYPPSSTRF